MPPQRFSTSATALSMDAWSVTSRRMAKAEGPMDFAVCSARTMSISAMATVAPSRT